MRCFQRALPTYHCGFTGHYCVVAEYNEVQRTFTVLDPSAVQGAFNPAFVLPLQAIQSMLAPVCYRVDEGTLMEARDHSGTDDDLLIVAPSPSLLHAIDGFIASGHS